MQTNLDLRTKIEYLWNNNSELINKESQNVIIETLGLLDNGTLELPSFKMDCGRSTTGLKKQFC